jgi:hypothetical protein
MPQLEVTTKTSEQVWSSPDGTRKIHKLVMEYEGKPVAAKTYSDVIAKEGWSGTVDTYEKEGRNGLETFVRQVPKEGGNYGGGGGSRPAYQPKDEKAIQAMWAISQAIAFNSNSKAQVAIEQVEQDAKNLFLLVDVVKASESEDTAEKPDEGHDEVHEVPDALPEPLELEEVLNKEEA